MSKKDIQLLLKDISGRLLYGVQYRDTSYTSKAVFKILGLDVNSKLVITNEYVRYGNTYSKTLIEFVKPYLRPMSDMTEEERKEYNDIVKNTIEFYNCPKSEDVCFFITPIDWLNKKMFDYRGLIPMGLAEVSPKNMYKI